MLSNNLPTFTSPQEMLAAIPTVLRRKTVELAFKRMMKQIEAFEQHGYAVTVAIRVASEWVEPLPLEPAPIYIESLILQN